MAGRITALKRILLVIPGIIYTYGFAILLYLIFIPYFVLDVIAQLIIGGDGLPGNAWLAGVYEWHMENTMFILLNEGEWRWIP